jgi:hypothetical protein
MYRTKGIIHTIKDGVVIENALLMKEIERMVKMSKEGVDPENIMTSPFLVD